MTALHEELLQMADQLDRLAESSNDSTISEPLAALEAATKQIGRSFSGSWLGYHANVYYEGLTSPPPGAHFSQEWGLKDLSYTSLGSKGDWYEYSPEEVKSAIQDLAKKPDLGAAHQFNEKAIREFQSLRSEVLSILETALDDSTDSFLQRIKEEVSQLSDSSVSEVVDYLRPKRQVMTRDAVALGQGTKVPPHISLLAEVLSIQHTIGIIKTLAQKVREAGSHLSRRQRQQKRTEVIGTNVFIGHGRSLLWREIKDFIEDRLGLPVDEFNRIPVAGITNIARLSEMLDAAAIAFLIMTGEDEQADGQMRARMNVVHEAGLFQGRLGFTRAIVLLEEGCDAFSNIDGLGQIRFPKGNIKAAFEEVRQVLEREEIIST